MIFDPNAPVQFSSEDDGTITVRIPPNSVNWKELVKAVMPAISRTVEQYLTSNNTSGGGPTDGGIPAVPVESQPVVNP
jgi:hypothetical protein